MYIHRHGKNRIQFFREMCTRIIPILINTTLEKSFCRYIYIYIFYCKCKKYFEIFILRLPKIFFNLNTLICFFFNFYEKFCIRPILNWYLQKYLSLRNIFKHKQFILLRSTILNQKLFFIG